jgi:hypothetical protein
MPDGSLEALHMRCSEEMGGTKIKAAELLGTPIFNTSLITGLMRQNIQMIALAL